MSRRVRGIAGHGRAGGGGAERRSLLALALLAAAAAGGCDDGGSGSAAPLSPNGLGGIEAAVVPIMSAEQGGAFYWYGDTKIFLDPVPGEFVVRTRQGAEPAGAAREALSELEAGVSEKRRVLRKHRVLAVSGGGPPEEVADRLRQHPRIGFASPVYRTREDGWEVVPLNTLVVKFRDGTSPEAIDGLNAAMGTRIVREPVESKGWRYHILAYPESGTESPLEIAAAYARHELTEWADPNKLAGREPAGWADPNKPADREPADVGGADEPLFGLQWYLDDNPEPSSRGPIDLDMRGVWPVTTGAPFITVAILDAGIDPTHEDLPGDIIDGGNFFDEDPGATACDGTPPGALAPECGDIHGTAVAGIIAGQHNGKGIAGIASGVRLVSIRILNGLRGGVADDEALADAIGVAWAGFGADVIDNSWSAGPPADMVTAAIRWAVLDGRGKVGTSMVFSSGNWGTASVKYPASVDYSIAVGAIDRFGNRPTYVSYGPELDLAGLSSKGLHPCINQSDIKTWIRTTQNMEENACPDPDQAHPNYVRFGGTSAPAPRVTAAIALALSLYPGLSVDEIRAALVKTADDWGDDNLFGAGKLDIEGLLDELAATAPSDPRPPGGECDGSPDPLLPC